MINTISQYSPLIAIIPGVICWQWHDKGLRGIFWLCCVGLLFEIINCFSGGLFLIYQLWTPVEVGFLFYIYSRWDNRVAYKPIIFIYYVMWIVIKVTGLEPYSGIDSFSISLESGIFIILTFILFTECKKWQQLSILTTAFYFAGCLMFVLSINFIQEKSMAWNIHSIFNILLYIGYGIGYGIRYFELSNNINNSMFCNFHSDNSCSEKYK